MPFRSDGLTDDEAENLCRQPPVLPKWPDLPESDLGVLALSLRAVVACFQSRGVPLDDALDMVKRYWEGEAK